MRKPIRRPYCFAIRRYICNMRHHRLLGYSKGYLLWLDFVPQEEDCDLAAAQPAGELPEQVWSVSSFVETCLLPANTSDVLCCGIAKGAWVRWTSGRARTHQRCPLLTDGIRAPLPLMTLGICGLCRAWASHRGLGAA